MCGRTVNVVHLFVIGPTILLSAYYGWTTPLYILGGGVVLIHGWKFIQEVLLGSSSLDTITNTASAGAAADQVDVRGNSLLASGPFRSTKRASSACSSCSGGY